MRNFFMLGILGLLLNACGAKGHYVIKGPERALSTYQKIEVLPFKNKIEDSSLSEKKMLVLNDLTNSVQKKIEKKVNKKNRMIDKSAPERLVIDGSIIKYKPGNRVLRYIIGFVGSSRMTAEVHFKDSMGHILSTVEFVGGVSLGIMGGDNSSAVNRMVNEIIEYIEKSRP